MIYKVSGDDKYKETECVVKACNVKICWQKWLYIQKEGRSCLVTTRLKHTSWNVKFKKHAIIVSNRVEADVKACNISACVLIYYI